VNVNKAKLEGLFVDELALLQPTAGYMRLVRDRVLHVWQQVTFDVKDRTPSTVYVGTQDGGLFMSGDGGGDLTSQKDCDSTRASDTRMA
jgi:hypothetical protein